MKLISRIFVIAVLLFSTITNQLYAQQYLPCGIFQAEQQQQLLHPEMAITRAQLEKFTADYVRNFPQQKTSSGIPIYTIPVVFHIMHNYGAENISKAQVLDAVRIINEDFQKLNADTIEIASVFKPIAADCQIQFKLAQIDPNGNCTDGITRTATTLTYNADDNVKYLIAWPNQKYLNIWVVRNISFGAAGYAYYPGIGAPEDGIVLRYDYTGSIGAAPNSSYNRHSLTHEIGHYLNLRHTWGNSNDPGVITNCNDDDLVFDTPNTIGTANFTCDTTLHTCGAAMPDNVQNYMDYASCHNMFTAGQKTRLFAALNSGASGRSNLWSSSNLIATGTNDGYVPVACSIVPDFQEAHKGICAGSTVTYRDLSWNNNVPYTRSWSFPAGNPSTSTDSIPVVTYSTPGVYDATLTLTNAAGTFVLTRQQYVTVTPVTGTVVAPFVEGFESIALPGTANWTIENDGGPAWQITTGAAATGAKSIWVQNNGANPIDEQDIFITEGYDLTNIGWPTFSFKVAFATKFNSNDRLKVYTSNNCGQTWVLRYNKDSAALATAGNFSGNFIPTANQWRTESFPISTYHGTPNLRFKFEFTNQGGNHIYIDDINIGSSAAGIDQLNAEALHMSIQPNPAQQQTILHYSLDEGTYVKAVLLDITGRQVMLINDEIKQAGSYSVTINKPANGMFFLKLLAGDRQIVQKIIFE